MNDKYTISEIHTDKRCMVSGKKYMRNKNLKIFYTRDCCIWRTAFCQTVHQMGGLFSLFHRKMRPIVDVTKSRWQIPQTRAFS